MIEIVYTEADKLRKDTEYIKLNHTFGGRRVKSFKVLIKDFVYILQVEFTKEERLAQWKQILT